MIKIKKKTIFREKATSALAGFYCNLGQLVFVEGGKPRNLEKNPQGKVRTNNKLKPHMAPDQGRNWATFVGEKRPHHCAIPAPKIKMLLQRKSQYLEGISAVGAS